MNNSRKILIQELIIFTALAIIGLITAGRLLSLSQRAVDKAYGDVRQIPELKIIKQEASPLSQAGDFIFYFIVATILLMGLLKVFKRNKIIFEFLFSGGMWVGIMLVIGLWLGDLVGLIIASGLIALRLLYPKVWTHDLILVLGLAGVVGALGIQIPALTMVIIILVLAIYDFIAVYKTKHMVWMAKEMIKRKVIFAIIVPTELKNYQADLKQVQPRQGFAIMGTGDLALPMVLAVGVLSNGLVNSLVVVVGILLGVILANYIFQKTKKPIPALPPIGLGAVLGWVVTLCV